jgi:two-component system, cell cycle sensor histidine kinase and response regulator CckA
MGGWETLAALRTLRSDIPVVLASGFDKAQVMHNEHLERPQAFLHKPYGMRDLKGAVGRALKASPH